jgi:LysR family transcriptional regulator, benzoate and cis,cis-muconate-responsive activator of ben and cat genes
MSEFLNLDLVRSLQILIEEGKFRSAAERLNVTPSALTQQVRRLEKRVGVALVDRASVPISLTTEGSRFMVHASAALDEALLAVNANHRPRVRVGFIHGFTALEEEGLADTLERVSPQIEVKPMQLGWDQQIEALLRGRVDASLARPPHSTTEGIDRIEVHREARCVAVPSVSPLASRTVLSVGELDGIPVVGGSHVDESWTKWWTIDPRPSGEPVVYGALINTIEEGLAAVASQGNVMITSASVAQKYRYNRVTFVRLEDTTECVVELCTLAWDRRPQIRALREAAHVIRG